MKLSFIFIQNSKEKIGDNLGNFVVENFLSPQNIRPYMLKLNVSKIAGKWLAAEKNQKILIHELSELVISIMLKLDDRQVVHFIRRKTEEMSENLHLNSIVGNGIDYILKPFQDKEIHNALNKYKQLVGTIRSKVIPAISATTASSWKSLRATAKR